MKLSNPFTMYSKYAARVILKDGRIMGKSGGCPSEIELPLEKEDVALITLSAFNNRNEEQDVKMYHDGVWKAYDEKLIDALQKPKSKPKQKRKSKPKKLGLLFDVAPSKNRAPFVVEDRPDPIESEVDFKLDKEGVKNPVDPDLEEDMGNEWGLGCT